MKIIGHRGARGLAPENTLASLRKAVEHKVDMIEFDVRVTADGIPVLHHNPKISVNNKSLAIDKYTFKELAAFKEDLIGLDTAMVFIDAKTAVYIEVKPGINVAPIVEILDSAYINKMYSADQIYLASKSQKVLRGLHKALPEIQKIVIEPWSGVHAHYRAKQVDAKIISMNQLFLWRGFISRFKNNEIKLYAYTLNDPVKAKRWEKWGLSGAVTDYPDRFS